MADNPSTASSLLLRVREKTDREAWETFVRVYAPVIYGYCRRRGLQPADAENVAQDTLLTVSRAIEKFEYDPQRGRFRGWLAMLTRQALFRHVQQSQRQPAIDAQGPESLASVEADPVWDETFQSSIYSTAVQRVQAEFSPEVWFAFDAAWNRDVPPVDVARQMERSVSWVYQSRHRVLKRLRSEVEYLAEDTGIVIL